MKLPGITDPVSMTTFVLVPNGLCWLCLKFAVVIDRPPQNRERTRELYKFPGGGVDEKKCLGLYADLTGTPANMGLPERQILQTLGGAVEILEETGLRINPLRKMKDRKIYEIHYPYHPQKLSRHLTAFYVSEPPENPEALHVGDGIKSCQWMSIREIECNIQKGKFVDSHAKAFTLFMYHYFNSYDCRDENCPLPHQAFQTASVA